MIERTMIKPYLHYVVPATIAFTLSCIYSIVDGLFVGNVVGDAGLAGINVAYPLYALVLATGTGVGMGGAVIASLRSGSGDVMGSRRATAHTLTLLACASLPIMTLLLLCARPLCALMGGQGETLEQAVLYLGALSLAAPLQVIVTGSLPLIRNRGHVKYAMCASIIAGVMNVILDYLFIVVCGMGTQGAGAATALSQCACFLFCIGFFFRKGERMPVRLFKPDTELIFRSLKIGSAPFGLTLLPQITIISININAMVYGGETAVAAYAVIAYVACVVQMMIQGIGDGSQPLISQCFGAGKYEAVQKLRNTNFMIALGLGLAGLLAMCGLRNDIPVWFGASAAATEIISYALPIIALAYAFFGFTHVATSYFYATGNAQGSSWLVYGEAVMVVAFTCLLGFSAGIMGVWSAVVVVQVMLSIMAAVLLHRATIKLLGNKAKRPSFLEQAKRSLRIQHA